MGFFGSIWSGISSVGSAICSGISSVARTVGRNVANAAETLVRGVHSGIETVKSVVGGVANKIYDIAKNFRMFDPDIHVDEIAEKSTRPDVRQRGDDESAIDYVDYLHNEVEFDEERWLSMKDEEKVAAKAIATTLMGESITEKTGVKLSPEFLLAMEKAKLSQAQVSKYIEEFSKRHLNNMDLVHKYLEGEVLDSKYSEVKEILTTAEKELNPSKSEEEINAKLVDMRIEYNKSNEEWGKLD